MRLDRAGIHVAAVLAASLAASMTASLAATAQGAGLPPGLDVLRRTERAFAKTTAEIGLRGGFLTFFRADALSPPDTSGARSWLLATPLPVEFQPTDLVWEPLFGDISRSGDLGYLTGPSSFTDREGEKRTGVYFSIWERDSLGLWKVVLDVGTDTPGPSPEFADATFRAADSTTWRGGGATHMRGSLIADDRALLNAARVDLAHAYEHNLWPNGRLHREGHHPVIGAEQIGAALRQTRAGVRGRHFRAGISADGDMGWTFGPADLVFGDKVQKGSYTHVWKRDDAGRWKLVVAILSPQRS